MEPASSSEGDLPVDRAGRDSADRRVRTVIEHAAGAWRRTKLGEVKPGPRLVGRPVDLQIDALLSRAIGNHAAEFVRGQARYPARGDAQASRGNGDVELT